MCLSDFTFMNQINMIQKHNCYNRHVHFEVVIQLELVISIKIRVIKCPRHEKFNCILFENLKYNLYKTKMIFKLLAFLDLLAVSLVVPALGTHFLNNEIVWIGSVYGIGSVFQFKNYIFYKSFSFLC